MLAEAEKFYTAILAARPDHFDALHGLGTLRSRQGDAVEALRLIDAALEANSRTADSASKLGSRLETLGRHEEARVALGRERATRQDRRAALVSRGVALLVLRRLPEALATFDEALVINGRDPEARINRGVALTQLDRAQEALAAFDLVLETAPEHPVALANRTRVLITLGRHAEAVEASDRVLAVNPRDAEVLYTRGNALCCLDKLEEAIESYERAWALNHARALCSVAVCRLALADWSRTDELAAALSERIAEGDYVHPFVAVVLDLSPLDQLNAARNQFRSRQPRAPKPCGRSSSLRSDKLRIAYVSADVRQHAVAYAIVELLERHDRSRFEIIGVSIGPDDASPIRARIVDAFDRFYDVSAEDDASVARRLNDLDVHVAVDLNGPTLGWRPAIFANRAAPVQAFYLGFPGTAGADFIDYILADETVLPFDQQAYFSERIVHLPDCYHAYDTTRRISQNIPSRPELGLPDQSFVFCCFNRTPKISAPVFDVWMQLLAKVHGSVLWLSETKHLVQQNLRHAAAARGVDPQRLVFAPYANRVEDHLARHRAADLFLDTLPFNAHSTACDALWAELPVVTCVGTAFAGRVAASMLNAAGMPELVTHSLDDYAALALKLATDAPFLQSIRRKLAQNRSTCQLFDGDRFRRGIEAAYTTMWGIHERGERPRGFRVGANAEEMN